MKNGFGLVSIMSSPNPQQGLGFNDIGPTLKLRRTYQKGAGCRKKLFNNELKRFYNPYIINPNYLPKRNQSGLGLGIGGLFASALRYLAPKIGPLLNSGLNAIKHELLSTGIDVLKNPTKQNLKKRSLQAVDNLVDKADKKIKLLSGAGAMKSGINPRNRKNKKHSRVKHRRVNTRKKLLNKKKLNKKKIVRRGRTKNKKRDIFG